MHNHTPTGIHTQGATRVQVYFPNEVLAELDARRRADRGDALNAPSRASYVIRYIREGLARDQRKRKPSPVVGAPGDCIEGPAVPDDIGCKGPDVPDAITRDQRRSRPAKSR